MFSKTLYKYSRFEYWPNWLIYLPVYPYGIWLMAKTRTPYFFALANPKMYMGGFFGASKNEALQQLAPALVPKTLLFAPTADAQNIKIAMNEKGIFYPAIAKPDRLERGMGVAILKNDTDLECYAKSATFDFLIQEYIDVPFEAGVFYHRLPSEKTGEVSGLVIKDFMAVVGDGKSTVAQLLARNKRAIMVADKLQKNLGASWESIPEAGKKIILEPIGNHNRGTKFCDATNQITQAMHQFYTEVANQLPEFYFGRFDLRAPSLADFLACKNIKIVEVNGANAEPAHMYDPIHNAFFGWKQLYKNWNKMAQIAKQNKKRGIKPPTKAQVKEAWALRQSLYSLKL